GGYCRTVNGKVMPFHTPHMKMLAGTDVTDKVNQALKREY
ncbi:MAG: hypothetical protein QOF56_3898, partial [Acidobacteriaceae bacterium]|nr:hypothetical protein [Acidobacteriaceae bacterium]